jgi:hypothetical protein
MIGTLSNPVPGVVPDVRLAALSASRYVEPSKRLMHGRTNNWGWENVSWKKGCDAPARLPWLSSTPSTPVSLILLQLSTYFPFLKVYVRMSTELLSSLLCQRMALGSVFAAHIPVDDAVANVITPPTFFGSPFQRKPANTRRNRSPRG